MAVVRRTWAGRSPFSADAEHMHHRLLQIGHSKRRAVLIMYFWSALISFTVVMFSVSSQSRPIVLGAMGFAFLGLVGLLLPRMRKHLGDKSVLSRSGQGEQEQDGPAPDLVRSTSGFDGPPPPTS
jgi:UDP-GlcNAc:undecaprenyl-phosphate GlcNAc-1-phosphate transferase